MPLVLKKNLKTATRAEAEEFIAQCQMKRLAATVVYFATQVDKMKGVSDKQKERLTKQRDMLGKDLDRVGDLLAKCEDRVQRIHQLEHEAESLDDRISEIEDAT